jgi:hypothetical protein
MLSLRLDKQPLEFSPGFGLNLVSTCPIFDRDRIGRVFSLPFSLPKSPKNLQVLGHLGRFDSKSAIPPDARLHVGASQYDSGELVITGSDETSIKAAFRNKPLTIAKRLGEIYINEILETLTIPDTGPPRVILLDVHVPPFAYDIHLDTIDYVLGIGGSSAMTHAEVCQYFRDQINADFPGLVTAYPTQIALDSDMINDLIPDWSGMTGFTINSYVTIGQSWHQSFLNYVEDVVDTPVASHCWPTVYWESFYEAANPQWANTVNPIFDGNGLENVEDENEQSFQWAYMPFVRVPYIIDKIKEAVGIDYVIGYIDDGDVQQMIVTNNRTVDQSFKDFYEDETWKYLNAGQTSINLNNHVPKITALDFLNRLATGLGFTIDYDENGMVWVPILDRIAPAPANWDKAISVTDYDMAIPEIEGVHLVYPKDEQENMPDVEDQLAAYDVAPAEHRVEMPFLTMITGTCTLAGHGDRRSPLTKRKGQSPLFGGGTSNMPLGFLLYRGLKDTSTGQSFPYAANDELDVDEIAVIGGLSLQLGGDYGLVNQVFGETILYGDKRTINISAVVSEGELHRLRKWDNARVRFYHRNGTVTAVLREFSFDAEVAGTGMMKVRCKAIVV